MNETFHEFVTGGAFVLTLTKRQIEALGLLGGDHWEAVSAFSHGVPICRALERRGLIVHHPRPDGVDPSSWRPWRLTRAGELTVGLLHEAGLLAPAADVRSAA